MKNIDAEGGGLSLKGSVSFSLHKKRRANPIR